MPTTAQIVTVAVVLLAVAFLFPTIINSADDGTATATITVGNGSGNVVQVEDAMRVIKVSQNGDNATIEVIHLNDNASAEFSIQDGDSRTFQLANDTVTVDAVRISSNDGEIVLDFTYPVTMGWTPESAEISRNLPVVFAAIPVILILGLLAKVVK